MVLEEKEKKERVNPGALEGYIIYTSQLFVARVSVPSRPFIRLSQILACRAPALPQSHQRESFSGSRRHYYRLQFRAMHVIGSLGGGGLTLIGHLAATLTLTRITSSKTFAPTNVIEKRTCDKERASQGRTDTQEQ